MSNISKVEGLIASVLLANNDINYQRSALEEALDRILEGDIQGAIHELGDGVDHAFREGWTEQRPEVDVCLQAFRLLTADQGGAA